MVLRGKLPINLGYLPGKLKQMNPKGYNPVDFKNIYTKLDGIFAEKVWSTIYLGNHDQSRMVTRWVSMHLLTEKPVLKYLLLF